jgi:hypothetical protein
LHPLYRVGFYLIFPLEDTNSKSCPKEEDLPSFRPQLQLCPSRLLSFVVSCLFQAQLAVGEGASIPLPEQGKIFWVHYEDGQVENRETSKEEVIEKASNVELELMAGERSLLKRRIPLMACIRKLGNLYRRAWRNRCGSGSRVLVSEVWGIDLCRRRRGAADWAQGSSHEP